MKYNEISNTGIIVSELCFGTWGVSGDWGKQYSHSYRVNLFKYAVKKGINFFDTAPVYGNGSSEKALSSINDVVIMTKLPAIRKPVNKCDINKYYSRKRMDDYINVSLNNLNRETIDVLLLHNWHPSWNRKSGKVLSHLDDIKNIGKVKAIGISIPDNYNNNLDLIIESGRIDCLEMPMNLLQNWALKEIIPKAIEYNVAVFVRSPLARGILSGKSLQVLLSNDKQKQYFQDNYNSQYLDNICKNLNITIDELPQKAIEYCKNIKGITSTIIGMSSNYTVNKNI